MALGCLPTKGAIHAIGLDNAIEIEGTKQDVPRRRKPGREGVFWYSACLERAAGHRFPFFGGAIVELSRLRPLVGSSAPDRPYDSVKYPAGSQNPIARPEMRGEGVRFVPSWTTCRPLARFISPPSSFYILRPRRQRRAQLDQLAVLIDQEIVFDAHPKVFLRNIYSRFYSETLPGPSGTCSRWNRER